MIGLLQGAGRFASESTLWHWIHSAPDFQATPLAVGGFPLTPRLATAMALLAPSHNGAPSNEHFAIPFGLSFRHGGQAGGWGHSARN
jgi:hypothetical protein